MFTQQRISDDGTIFQKHPRDNQEILCCVEDATREDMEITFLGTGSSQPSKYRNVCSIYLTCLLEEVYFLTAVKDLRTTKKEVRYFSAKMLLGSATPQLENTRFAPGSRIENYNRKPASPRDSTALANFKEVLQESGLEILYRSTLSTGICCCFESHGEGQNVIPGWKVVYFGDARLCPALIDASSDATVLIHEATFEDSMKDEAIATKEAIAVGISAGGYQIILTYSQRYPKTPVIDEVDMEKTCIAVDRMSVNLADLPVLPKVLPHLKVADEIQEAAAVLRTDIDKNNVH